MNAVRYNLEAVPKSEDTVRMRAIRSVRSLSPDPKEFENRTGVAIRQRICSRPLYFLRQRLYLTEKMRSHQRVRFGHRGNCMHPHPNSTTDPTSEPRSVMSKTWRLILIGAGSGFVALGVLGIFLPVMPTTIFLLLAAACFVRSSDRLHRWLRNHRVLGPYLRAVQGRSGIPLRAKVTTLVVLWISILSSAFIFVDMLWLRVLLLAIATGVSILILSRKTMKSAGGTDAERTGKSDEPDRQGITACREAGCT